MLKKLLPIFMLCAVALAMTSCLEDENTELVYYDDTAVTAFSVGTLNKYVTMKSSSDSDSIVKSTIDASSYKFSISNNAPCTIYNVDSLPYGVDTTKVLCSITTKNSGVALWYLKSSAGKDSLAYFSSTDSLDFTGGRILRVYNTNMTAYRQYTVRLNVHQEVADSFVWKEMPMDANLASLKAMRLVCADSTLYLFGYNGNSTVLYCSATTPVVEFGEALDTLSADAYKNVGVFGDTVYVLDGSRLKSLRRGAFTDYSIECNAARFLGFGNGRMYAYNAEGGISCSEDGKTWTESELSDDKKALPTENVSLLSMPSLTNADTYTLTLVGDTANAEYANVWGKVDEGASAAYDQPWSVWQTDNGQYRLPALRNLQTFVYGRKIMAVGGDGLSDTNLKALDRFYSSKDAGLTWRVDSALSLPSGLQSSSEVFAMTIDADNYIWMVCGESGQIWRGRLNKLGWAIKE